MEKREKICLNRSNGLYASEEKRFQIKLLLGLLVLALLTPLGIILPKLFNAGSAWGEWEPSNLASMLGFIPEGLKRTAGVWRAPVPGYSFSQAGDPAIQALSYVLSAVFGLVLVVFLVVLLTRKVLRHEE